eukprot:c10870_g1_i1.p1 GENE.c10870_g1_i1~~c10870_g1_i1.p1  ORF type:complete len:598 (-),score=125.65 c10870_g1_i1:119-1912(-)
MLTSFFRFGGQVRNEVFVVRFQTEAQHFDKNIAELLRKQILIIQESKADDNTIELRVEPLKSAPQNVPVTNAETAPESPSGEPSAAQTPQPESLPAIPTLPQQTQTTIEAKPQRSFAALVRSFFSAQPPSTNSFSTPVPTPKERNVEVLPSECSVCYATVDHNSSFVPRCIESRLQHQILCQACAREYVNTAVRQRQFPIVCTDVECGEEWTDDDLFEAVGGVGTPDWSALQWARISQLINNAERVVYCPIATCTCAMQIPFGRKPSVLHCVKCNARLCLRCDSHHPDISCRQYREQKREQGLVEARRVIREVCKPCPRCRSPIEKNEGCNHMTCRKCRHQFCWICLKPHFGHSSNRCKPPQNPWGTSTKYKMYALLLKQPVKKFLRFSLYALAAPVVIVVGGPIFIVFKIVKTVKAMRRRFTRWYHRRFNKQPTGSCDCVGTNRCYMCASRHASQPTDQTDEQEENNDDQSQHDPEEQEVEANVVEDNVNNQPNPAIAAVNEPIQEVDERDTNDSSESESEPIEESLSAGSDPQLDGPPADTNLPADDLNDTNNTTATNNNDNNNNNATTTATSNDNNNNDNAQPNEGHDDDLDIL